MCPGIAWAKRTFDTYPSAYANMAASKYCKDPNYAKGAKRNDKFNGYNNILNDIKYFCNRSACRSNNA